MTISSKLFATQMLDQFKFIENRLQNLNTQIATGTRITQSSDAPLDAVTLTARNELEARLEQFQSNLNLHFLLFLLLHLNLKLPNYLHHLILLEHLEK